MRGPFSTPITPLTGSLFHADPQGQATGIIQDLSLDADHIAQMDLGGVAECGSADAHQCEERDDR